MKRRTFLKSGTLLPMVAYFPVIARASSEQQNVLILVQLGGGNDSLNTFIPYSDPAYYQARSNLAIDSNDVIPLNDQLGMNPVMLALEEAWHSADMAVVQGLGYPDPNRSHFRGIDIWHTASSADEVLQSGWLNESMPIYNSALQGVILNGSPGAFKGEPNQFSLNGEISELSQVYAPIGAPSTDAISHIMSQQNAYNSAVSELTTAYSSSVTVSTEFGADDFSQQCQLTAQILASGVRPHVLHLSLGSFDTHSNQRNAHDTLLQQMAQGLASLRKELMLQGLWQNVTIATYSEFGRRVAVNGSDGTDHGTAASHLVLGGSVNGGLYGAMPSLTDLDNGDLKYTADFRSYYRSLSDWMQWTTSNELAPFDNLGFVS